MQVARQPCVEPLKCDKYWQLSTSGVRTHLFGQDGFSGVGACAFCRFKTCRLLED